MPEDSLSPQISIRPISADDTIAIRHEILWPHLPKDSDIIRLADDAAGLHFGAFVPGGAAPVGVISLFHEPVPAVAPAPAASDAHKAWRFRKFACLAEYQGKGVGSALLAHTLAHARASLGAEVVWCDARTTAAAWYARRGLTTFGEPFLKNGVEHVRMKIAL